MHIYCFTVIKSHNAVFFLVMIPKRSVSFRCPKTPRFDSLSNDKSLQSGVNDEINFPSSIWLINSDRYSDMRVYMFMLLCHH